MRRPNSITLRALVAEFYPSHEVGALAHLSTLSKPKSEGAAVMTLSS